jgi:hypothetical protein
MRKGAYINIVLLLFLFFLFRSWLGLFDALRLCNVLRLRRPGGGGDSGSERGWEVAAYTACLDLLGMVLEEAHLCLISRSLDGKHESLHLLDLVRRVNSARKLRLTTMPAIPWKTPIMALMLFEAL